jgi:hypothetical protein
VLLASRLAPDMLSFTRQLQLMSDFAKNAAARRRAAAENPRFPDEEKSFEELKARIARTLDFIASVDKAALDAGLEQGRHLPARPFGHRDDEGRRLPHALCRAELLFPRHDGLRRSCGKTASQIGKQDFLKGVFEA